MDRIITLMNELSPDAMSALERRYNTLRSLSYIQPAGRRQLAEYTDMTEREARSETDQLKKQGLIQSDSCGMRLTSEGMRVLLELYEAISAISDKRDMELALASILNIKAVSIVSGDADQKNMVYRDMGARAAKCFQRYAADISSAAVTGHKTVEYMTNSRFISGRHVGLSIYPIRTAQLNSEVDNANNNCARLARKMGANYRLLHLGEGLTINEIEKRYQSAGVKEAVAGAMGAEVIVSGVNSLNSSPVFNAMSVRARESLLQEDACCELLGNFLKKDGKQINNPPIYSTAVEELGEARIFMLIAGGASSYDAISALACRLGNMHLITDETTAGALIRSK